MGTAVRAFEPNDADAVAGLFVRLMRPRNVGVAEAADYFRTVYLGHPWACSEASSKVCVDDSRGVVGFIGVLPIRMTVDGQPSLCAACGPLLSDPDGSPGTVGAQLLKNFVQAAPALAVSDTATPVAHAMWKSLGGKVAHLQSLSWVRTFRPAARVAAKLGPAAPVAGRLAGPVDRLLSRALGKRLKLDALAGHDDIVIQPCTDDQLFEMAQAFSAQHRVAPAWDRPCFDWLLARARTFGTIEQCAVLSDKGALLGAFLYSGSPPGEARVLQVFTRPRTADMVMQALLRHVFDRGFAAARGSVQHHLMDTLFRHGARFGYRGMTLIKARDRQTQDVMETASAFLGGDLLFGLEARGS